jgi:hypothetical protein
VAPTTAPQTVTLGANANTYVQNASPASNYGNSTSLTVSVNAVTGSWIMASDAYLRFDMTKISGTVSSAVLELTPLAQSTSNAKVSLAVYLVPDAGDGWVEGTGGWSFGGGGPMTWSNQPGVCGSPISISSSQWLASGPLSINVTSLVNNQKLNANKIASFALGLVAPVGAQGSLFLASRENSTAGYQPSLVVTTNAPPPPQPQPPTVAVAAAAGSSTVTGTSTSLSVLGADSAGESSLSYVWSTTAKPTGAPAPTFRTNGTNAAKNDTVSFGKAGTYTLMATITDATGLSCTSSVTVTVGQTLSCITVNPGSVSLSVGATQQFAAAGLDQFGNPLTAAPSFKWTTTAGTISSGGLLTAPATAGSLTVTAASGAVQGTASVTVTSSTTFLGLKDPVLASLVQSLDADGSINRQDMIQILESVGGSGGLSATDFGDLKTIISDAAQLDMPGYVSVLAGDVVNGNPANAHYQGQSLGNLAAGSSTAQLDDLVNKWFEGTDLPLADANIEYNGNQNWSYATASGTLFGNTPSHLDEVQGLLGDCYLISSVGSIADRAPAAIQNMFIYNGDNTWTVRFYVNGTADYVTVNRMLPVSGGQLVYADYGSLASNASNVLWIPLIEKAYAEWDETGNEGRSNVNTYADIEGGWMADVDAQVLGHAASSYNLVTASDQAALVSGMTNNMAVTIGTISSSSSDDSLPYGLYGDHAYAVIGYNATAGTFVLYNPWGTDQPPAALSWAQLQATCDGFVVANPAGTVPISQVRASSTAAMAAGTLSGTPRAPASMALLASPLGPSSGLAQYATVWGLDSAQTSPYYGRPAVSAQAVDAVLGG